MKPVRATKSGKQWGLGQDGSSDVIAGTNKTKELREYGRKQKKG